MKANLGACRLDTTSVKNWTFTVPTSQL